MTRLRSCKRNGERRALARRFFGHQPVSTAYPQIALELKETNSRRMPAKAGKPAG